MYSQNQCTCKQKRSEHKTREQNKHTQYKHTLLRHMTNTLMIRIISHSLIQGAFSTVSCTFYLAEGGSFKMMVRQPNYYPL